jgi:hypothetical protein
MTELRKSNSGLRFLRHELSVLLFQHITRWDVTEKHAPAWILLDLK